MEEEGPPYCFHRLDRCRQRFHRHLYSRLHQSLHCLDQFLCFPHQPVHRYSFQRHQEDHHYHCQDSWDWFLCWLRLHKYQYWFQSHHLNHLRPCLPWLGQFWFLRIHPGRSIHHRQSLRFLLLVLGLHHFHSNLPNYRQVFPRRSQAVRLHPNHHPFFLSG